ncbi:MAG: hypothetical protein EVA89_37815 [Sandaracinaceae bacterium]|nr:MAG: hypothetical protein EVA89_37815 [Sandaracinaceae bacterium]
MPKWSKRALDVLLGIALTLAAFSAALWLHLGQSVGRVAVADAVTALVSGEIPGAFTLEDVRDAHPGNIRVGTLRMDAPNGRTVLELHDIEATLDVARSWSEGGLILTRARVGDGHVDVTEAADGRTYLEHAVSHGGEEDGGEKQGDSGGGGFSFRFEDVRFRSLNTRLAPRGGPTLQLSDASGRARLWLPPRNDVQLRFWSVAGHLRTQGIPMVGETPVDGLALTIDPTSAPVVRFATGARLTGSHVTVAGGIGGPNHQPRICVWTGGPSLATVLGLGAELVVPLFSDLDLDVRPSEAPRRPRCEEGA